MVRSPQLNIPKDFLICLKAESTFQPSPVDIIDISSYTQPPVAQGSIAYVMGDVSSSSQVSAQVLTLPCIWFQIGWQQIIGRHK